MQRDRRGGRRDGRGRLGPTQVQVAARPGLEGAPTELSSSGAGQVGYFITAIFLVADRPGVAIRKSACFGELRNSRRRWKRQR